MANQITGTALNLGGIDQYTENKVVGHNENTYGSRFGNGQTGGTSGVAGATYVWTGNTFTRTRPDSTIYVNGIIKGHDDWSYPYYGTFVQLRNQDGTQYTSWIGSSYIHHVDTSGSGHQDNYHVTWFVKKAWTPAEIGTNFGGTWQIWYGYAQSSGSGNRPFTIMNPSKSDDNRGYQQFSTSYVTELAPN